MGREEYLLIKHFSFDEEYLLKTGPVWLRCLGCIAPRRMNLEFKFQRNLFKDLSLRGPEVLNNCLLSMLCNNKNKWETMELKFTDERNSSFSGRTDF